MLSTKIDLTERNDFSRGDGQLMGYPVPPEVYYGEMTIEQFSRLHRWEGIFGKMHHDSEYYDVFFQKLPFYKKATCYRCGKEIKIPWKFHTGICEKCRNEKEIPWRERFRASSNTDYDLFNSK
jgi:hypothetical protein